LNAISIEQIDALIDSYRTRLLAVLALQGRSLNGNRDVLKDLESGGRTVEEMQAARQAEQESVQPDVQESGRSVAELLPGGPENSYREVMQESKRILAVLLWATQEKTHMLWPDPQLINS
jgi:hypothetical protein